MKSGIYGQRHGRESKVQIISAFLISILLTIQFFAAGLSFADGLIPPTRTLGESEKQWGGLIVFSEPPGVDVYLDDSKVGVTPLWLVRVESGIHTLRVENKEARIYVKQGKRIKAGLFKGSFITREEEDVRATPQPGPEEKPVPRAPAKEQVAEEERKRDLTAWDLFVNGPLF